MRYAHLSLLLLAAVCAAPAAAQTAVNQSHPLARGGRVELENIAGQIRVRGWDRDEVALTGTLGEGQRLEVDASSNRLQLEVIYPHTSRSSKGAQLELRVPRGAMLQVAAVSASVDVDQVDLAQLRLKSVSGDVVARGRAKEAQLETVSGTLRSTVSSGRVTLGTVSGQIDAQAGASGVVSAESVSGDIRIGAGQVSQLRSQSVSGSASVTVAGLAPGGSISAESVSGTITLGVPRNVSAALNVEVFSGDIHSVAGRVERPEYGPGKSLRATLGAGNGDIKLESHSGSVRIDYSN
ncbi:MULTISPECIES: DUF4097 family beta strand repeat-containing protein [Xanthomonas]|uniref:DUF4097 family beta strand repeat-containing protein n=1 Tax=Xanthomonas TaxID=338 RepID=UPI0006F86F15|nr:MULTISPECIES: DUF4097 family beta strand repeat-containing protein [Xanthomonas]KQR18695.1 hypothetical protein ASF90_02180 [Xanthomonas sp. Leaf148]MEA9563008.1 DUF4097 family beta strand repeat-containing protein [Xanthomonas sp. WHRI 8932A]MEA9578385.1 DUF4097 family beta strand repeat-containing protein [Xanthomonas nasturtii]MEA9634061.1 DUF4097 family beta strand repeat-containing protein [Xanthomonas sp. WHRI 8812E]